MAITMNTTFRRNKSPLIAFEATPPKTTGTLEQQYVKSPGGAERYTFSHSNLLTFLCFGSKTMPIKYRSPAYFS